MKSSTLCVFGTGYVGLVTAACLAEIGHQVRCVDVDAARLEGLAEGRVPFHEPSLDAMVRHNIDQGRLMFFRAAADALRGAAAAFIAVGTPPRADGSADTSQVLAAGRDIARHAEGDLILVVKSTVPVGTADTLRASIEAARAGNPAMPRIQIVSNPEFLREGQAVADCMRPDRILLGGDDPAALDALAAIYRGFDPDGSRTLRMDGRSAEFGKYAANAMLATRISFMNEMAELAEVLGADIEQVRPALGMDPRIGPLFLRAGIGFGGSCFPKDLRALAWMGRQAGRRARLVETVDAVNRERPVRFVERILDHHGNDLHGVTLAVWGLAFKPETDNMREAPSLAVIDGLLRSGASLRLHDPVAMGQARRIVGERPGLTWCASAEDACTAADGIVLLTEWPLYRQIDLGRIADRLRRRVLFDGRNLWREEEVRPHGFAYRGIGRAPAADGGDPALGAIDTASLPAAARQAGTR